MNALRAGVSGGLVGTVLGGGVFAFARFRFPSLLGDSGDATTVVLGSAAAVGVAALVLGGFFGRRGFGLAAGLGAAAVAAGFTALFLTTPSPAAIGGTALVVGALATVAFARPLFQRKAGNVLLVVGALALLLLGAVAPKAPVGKVDPERPRIFVFGLDAGTWTILNELFAKNELPNLRRIRDEGTSGILRSDVASLSPRVWTTIATGKLPDKHGVLDFACCQNENLKTRRIWEMLQSPDGGNWSVGLFQWLITWPPDPFDPFIVPAWMARGPQTQPPALSFIKEMELAFQKGDVDEWLRDPAQRQKGITTLRNWVRGYLDHGLRLGTVLKCANRLAAARDTATAIAAAPEHAPGKKKSAELLDYAAKRTIQLWMNGDVYLDLYRRGQPDFSCMILYGTDNLAHKLWQYHFPDDFNLPREQAAPFADLLTDYYKAADALLGEILPLLPERTTIAVLSDHGFTSKGAFGDSSQREMRPRVSKLVRLAGLEAETASAEIATHGIVTPRARDAAAAAATTAKLAAYLEGCVAKSGGQKLFVLKPTAGGGFQVDVDGSGNFEATTRITAPDGEHDFSDLVAIEDRTGNHSIDGIVLLKGPNVRRGHHLEGARLQDMTPTLLYLMGKPVGSDMDGEVLYDAVAPEFFESSGRAERIESWDKLVPITRDASITGDIEAANKYMAGVGYINGDDDEKKKAPAKPDPAQKNESTKKDGAK